MTRAVAALGIFTPAGSNQACRGAVPLFESNSSSPTRLSWPDVSMSGVMSIPPPTTLTESVHLSVSSNAAVRSRQAMHCRASSESFADFHRGSSTLRRSPVWVAARIPVTSTPWSRSLERSPQRSIG